MATVGVEKVAGALNLDKRRVQQLVKEGMPRETRGQYDPVKCMLWYIRYLQKVLEKTTVPMLDGAFLGERHERIRLLRAEADLREIELSEQRSKYVAIEDVVKATAELRRVTTEQVMAVAPRLAPQLLGEPSRLMVHAKIEKALKEVLLNLSKHPARNDRCVYRLVT